MCSAKWLLHLYICILFGVKGWHRWAMWPEFKSGHRHHHHVGCFCWWFSSFLQEVFLWVLWFSLSSKTNISLFSIHPGKLLCGCASCTCTSTCSYYWFLYREVFKYMDLRNTVAHRGHAANKNVAATTKTTLGVHAGLSLTFVQLYWVLLFPSVCGHTFLSLNLLQLLLFTGTIFFIYCNNFMFAAAIFI